MTKGKQPDYKLTCFDKTNSARSELGSAWIDDGGSITLKLNPGCSLVYATDFVYKLGPTEQKEVEAPPAKRAYTPRSQQDFDDDIPF